LSSPRCVRVRQVPPGKTRTRHRLFLECAPGFRGACSAMPCRERHGLEIPLFIRCLLGILTPHMAQGRIEREGR
jgi:hypothetical protein